MLVYVDDIIVASSSQDIAAALLRDLAKEFAIKDLGDLHYFLGIEIKRLLGELLLTQERYAMGILKRVGMETCKPLSTPLSTTKKLSVREGDLLGSDDSTRYIGALWVLYSIWPSIALTSLSM